MKTYFVTGGAGFIGSALVRQLYAVGNCRIVNIDKLTYAGSLTSLPLVEEGDRYRFFERDICDRAAMLELFAKEQPDGVFHLAAESHVDRSIQSADAFIKTNLVGTFTLLDCARHYLSELSEKDSARAKAFRFLHVSTDEVYGALGDDGLFSEETAYDPRSPYSASKAGSDFLALAWFHTHDLPVVVSNCSNNYGPYHFPEKLIPLVIGNALNWQDLPVYGDGSNIRDWLFVDDHARALVAVLTKGRPGEKYNVGGRNERTNLQVVEAICDLVDAARPDPKGRSRRDLIKFVTDRKGHDFRYAIDATKLETELGWKASHNFDSGLALTVDWYLHNSDWWEPLRDRAKF